MDTNMGKMTVKQTIDDWLKEDTGSREAMCRDFGPHYIMEVELMPCCSRSNRADFWCEYASNLLVPDIDTALHKGKLEQYAMCRHPERNK